LEVTYFFITVSIFFFYVNYLLRCNWRSSVKAIFFILVIEGILRKWVLPQASELIYFLKDLVLFGAYFQYYILPSSKPKIIIRNHSVTVLSLLVGIWCLCQAFNPSLGSPLVAFFGLKSYLYYIPLIWMIPNLFKSEEELYRFLRTHLFLLIPVGLLGIAQFFSPPSSPLNIYAPGAGLGIATFGSEDNNSVRITGSFSYIAGYGVFLSACFTLLLPMIFRKQSKLWYWIAVIEVLLILVNSLMTGSRSVVFLEILLLLGYILIQVIHQPAKTLRFLKKFIIPTIITAIAATSFFRPAINAFVLRTTSNQDVSVRLSGSFFEPLDFIKYKGIDGYGTGATHQAAPMLRNILKLPAGEIIPVGYESEMGRILLELGPFGFLFWYGLRLAILISLWNLYLSLQRPFLRQLALSIFIFHATQFNGQLVFNHILSVYYWFFSGFIFLLPQLEITENFYQERNF
jgi:hypothetical protein